MLRPRRGDTRPRVVDPFVSAFPRPGAILLGKAAPRRCRPDETWGFSRRTPICHRPIPAILVLRWSNRWDAMSETPSRAARHPLARDECEDLAISVAATAAFWQRAATSEHMRSPAGRASRRGWRSASRW